MLSVSYSYKVNQKSVSSPLPENGRKLIFMNKKILQIQIQYLNFILPRNSLMIDTRVHVEQVEQTSAVVEKNYCQIL